MNLLALILLVAKRAAVKKNEERCGAKASKE
jgi:hypothetical protein